MSQPYPDRGELDRGEEVVVTLVATGGDGSEVFALVEEWFDEVAIAVKEGLKAETRLRHGLTQSSAAQRPKSRAWNGLAWNGRHSS